MTNLKAQEIIRTKQGRLNAILARGEQAESAFRGKTEGALVFGSVVVATSQRVLILGRGDKVTEVPYAAIESIDVYDMEICISSPDGGRLWLKVAKHDADMRVPFVNSVRAFLGQPGITLHKRGATGRIGAQWEAMKPSTWGNRHSGEKEMLHSLLEANETMESLLGGTYRAEQDTSRVGKHEGIAVATNKRVLFVDKGVLGSTDVSEMPYRNIEAITYSTGAFFAGVQITGRGVASFRIEDIPDKDSVKPFVDCVRAHLEAAHAPQAVAAPQTAPPLSAADEIEKLASLLERGILTQEEFDAKKKQLLGL